MQNRAQFDIISTYDSFCEKEVTHYLCLTLNEKMPDMALSFYYGFWKVNYKIIIGVASTRLKKQAVKERTITK